MPNCRACWTIKQSWWTGTSETPSAGRRGGKRAVGGASLRGRAMSQVPVKKQASIVQILKQHGLALAGRRASLVVEPPPAAEEDQPAPERRACPTHVEPPIPLARTGELHGSDGLVGLAQGDGCDLATPQPCGPAHVRHEHRVQASGRHRALVGNPQPVVVVQWRAYGAAVAGVCP